MVTALRQHALVVTSDPDDLQHLASGLHSDLAVATVRELCDDDAADVPDFPDVGLAEFTGSASAGPAPPPDR